MAGVAMSTINSYSTGVFIQPLQDAFGWSRAEISIGPAITAPLVILFGPVIGGAVDRFGPRRIGIIGVLLLFAMNVALGFTGPSIWSWWLVWAGMAIANMFIQPLVWTAAISGLFFSGRGFALALTLSGSGLGSLITPYLSYQLIAHFGWRTGYFGLAAFWGVITILLVLFLFTSAKDKGRQASAPAAPKPVGGGRKLLSRRFIQLALAGWMIASVVMALVMNLVPLLSARAFSTAPESRKIPSAREF